MLDLLPTLRARRVLTGLLACVLLLVAAAPASAAIFDDVYADFAKDGAIDPCTFTSKELGQVRDDVPPDIEQYAPDFPAALTLAIEARGKGNCAKKKSQPSGGDSGAAPAPGGGGAATPGAPAAPDAAPAAPETGDAAPAPPAAATETPQPTPPPAPAAAAADGAIVQAAQVEPSAGRSDGLPAAVVGLGALAGFLAILALAWLIARALAWEPRWLPSARHSWQEAGWRMSATWADFTDWVRLGR